MESFGGSLHFSTARPMPAGSQRSRAKACFGTGTLAISGFYRDVG
ncbi:hypothetical protein CLJ1_4085 [Pseudomonas paraeruginosa]|nr:hypothetical protein CLJ1_4085 [Pseudomonas aeruginosa]